MATTRTREYDFPNATIKRLPNGTLREIPKWCPMISVDRSRAYVAQALRDLRVFKRTGVAPGAAEAAS